VEARQTLDHQPRPGVCPKKGRRDRLIARTQQHPDWGLGFADETWWSRVAQPQLHSWSAAADGALRLVEQAIPKGDPDPKALACYGVLLRQVGQPEQVWLRFVDGRPVSTITEQFLGWCCSRLQAAGVRVWALIWDNASWHVSKRVRAWIRTHNRQVKRQRHGVRILSCYLPVKSPWLNPIEPQWVHTKRAIVEPARLLSAHERADRVCAYFACSHEPHLSIPENVA
jgi:transposase